jgi:hypothetical protein
MLSQFNNEVLSYGPTAVLPQNFNSTWIKKNAEDSRTSKISFFKRQHQSLHLKGQK